MRIATWNLQTDKALPPRADAFRRSMAEVNADVWVITEALLSFAPGPDYRLIAYSSEALELKAWPERRWVGIWVRQLDARAVELHNEPDRSACIRIEQTGKQSLIVVGTVFPFPVDPKHGGTAAAFGAAVKHQASDWRCLRGLFPHAGFCVAGDFNESLPFQTYSRSKAGPRAIVEALEETKFVCLSAGEGDPLPALEGKPSIDHICIGGNVRTVSTPSARTWPIPTRSDTGKAITDHFGVWADVEVGAA